MNHFVPFHLILVHCNLPVVRPVFWLVLPLHMLKCRQKSDSMVTSHHIIWLPLPERTGSTALDSRSNSPRILSIVSCNISNYSVSRYPDTWYLTFITFSFWVSWAFTGLVLVDSETYRPVLGLYSCFQYLHWYWYATCKNVRDESPKGGTFVHLSWTKCNVKNIYILEIFFQPTFVKI